MVKRSRTEPASIAPGGVQSASTTGESIATSSVDDTGPSPKYIQLDEEYVDADAHDGTASSTAKSTHVMTCHLPPHAPLAFTTWEQHDAHYRQQHVNRCHACRRNFPSEHYLSLHIAEHHDPLRATLRERGEKTFACFVEGCDKVCLTPLKRRLHAIDKHAFPKFYDFFIVNTGIDGRNSMLRPGRGSDGLRSHARRASKAKALPEAGSDARNPGSGRRVSQGGGDEEEDDDDSDEEMIGNVTKASHASRDGKSSGPTKWRNENENDEDAHMDDLTSSMAALKFVPRNIKFGKGKAGFEKVQ